MKSLLVLFSLTLTSVAASAACNTQGLRAQLLNAFQVNSRPIEWQSVRTNTLEPNKSFPILVYPSRRLSSSRVIFRGKNYFLTEINVCSHQKGLEVQKAGLGTVYIVRNNSHINNAYIRVEEKRTRIKVFLRPKVHVKP